MSDEARRLINDVADSWVKSDDGERTARDALLAYIAELERERDDLLNPYTLTGWAKIRITELEAENARLQAIVDEQAEDEGLWFVAETAPEAYLQQELRRLHAAIDAARKP